MVDWDAAIREVTALGELDRRIYEQSRIGFVKELSVNTWLYSTDDAKYYDADWRPATVIEAYAFEKLGADTPDGKLLFRTGS